MMEDLEDRVGNGIRDSVLGTFCVHSDGSFVKGKITFENYNPSNAKSIIDTTKKMVDNFSMPHLTISEKIFNFFRTGVAFFRNTLETGEKYVEAMEAHNNKTLQTLQENDKLIIYVHGLMQNSGPWTMAVSDAEKRGYKAIALNYDFCDKQENVINTLKEIYRKVDVKAAKVAGIVAHSTGSNYIIHAINDIVFYNTAILHKTIFVLSAPSSGGIKPVTIAQRLINYIGKHQLVRAFVRKITGEDISWDLRDDYSTEIGNKELVALNKPLHHSRECEKLKIYNVICSEDSLVLPEQGIYLPSDFLVVVRGGGHLQGSGVFGRVNDIYLDCISGKYNAQN